MNVVYVKKKLYMCNSLVYTKKEVHMGHEGTLNTNFSVID